MTEHPMRPFVQLAVICQTAMQEVTGFLSIIRILDRLPLQGFTDQMQPQPLNQLTLAVILKSGEMYGKYTLKIVPETPSGKRLQPAEMPVLFERGERGVGVVMPLNFMAEEEGLYWFDVAIEQDILTRIPLRVMYQKMQPMPGIPLQGPQTG